MPSPGFIAPDLDPETEALLIELVDMARDLPRPQQVFMVSQPLGGGGTATIFCAGGVGRTQAAPQDLKALRRAGLTGSSGPVQIGTGERMFTLTRKATVLAEAIRRRGEPLERVEAEPVHYMDAAEFKSTYPEAAAKWSHAAALLDQDPIAHTTRIGHDCREAMAAFADALVEHNGAGHLRSGTGTVDAIRSVIEARRPELGGTVPAFLDALVAYWGTVSDLEQRQEHAAQRDGEALTAEDARRAVWYSALVMYELHRTFG